MKKMKTYLFSTSWETFHACCEFTARNSRGDDIAFDLRSFQLMCIDVAVNMGFWSHADGTASFRVDILNGKGVRRRTKWVHVDNPYVPGKILLKPCKEDEWQPSEDAVWYKASMLLQSWGQKLFASKLESYQQWSAVDVMHELLAELYSGDVPWENRLRYKACIPLMGIPEKPKDKVEEENGTAPETVAFAVVLMDDSILYITRDGYTETKPKGDVDSVGTKLYLATGTLVEANAEAPTTLQ